MADIKKIQTDTGRLRSEYQNLDLKLAKTKAELEKIESRIKSAALTPGLSDRLDEQKRRLVTEKNALITGLKRLKDLPADSALRRLDPLTDVRQLDDSYPLLLFPLRIETRFKKTDGQPQLWIRVYPDDCNVVKNEPLLTEDELKNARSFWNEMAKANGVESEERGAWTALVQAHGANRAAWIIDQYKPAGNNLPEESAFATTSGSWNKAPEAIQLPDKFVAVTYSGNSRKSFAFKNPVREYLPVGIDPSLEEGELLKDETTHDLKLPDDLQWMTDFDKAVDAGMAAKIDLTPAEARKGFDKIFVAGVRLTSNAQEGAKGLEELITAHRNSEEGFEFIKQGTPTNNTEESGSGYSWKEDPDESYDRIFKGTDNFKTENTYRLQADGQRFAAGMGINESAVQGVFNANSKDQAEAGTMNLALFPATMGYFMEEMMDPLFSARDIEDTKKFFSEYVSGRGPLPAIKIGRQPYGILPVTAFKRLKFDNGAGTTGESFNSGLLSVLKRIDKTWDKLVPQVSYVGKNDNSQQTLLDVLGLHANSVEFHQRYAQSVKQTYHQLLLLNSNTIASEALNQSIATIGRKLLTDVGIDPERYTLPILQKHLLLKPTLLRGALVDDIPGSETDPLRPYTADGMNYIEWLADTHGDKIRSQDFGDQPAPNAILYLLLRHSLLLSLSDTATRLKTALDRTEKKQDYFDSDILHLKSTETIKSKFDHLYSKEKKITNDNTTTLLDYIYKNRATGAIPSLREFRRLLSSLKDLSKIPTARLERLLIEHLDCCSYRLDAWKTGLVQKKLIEQRSANTASRKSGGLYLGAYGWLFNLRPKNRELQEMERADPDVAHSSDGKIYTDSSNLGYIHAPSVDQAATAAILRSAYESNRTAGGENPFAINLTSERIRIAESFLEGIRNGQSLGALLGYQFERGLHDKYATSRIEADRFIYPLRLQFPLVAGNLKSTRIDDAETIETIEARNVIDGLKLINHVQQANQKTYPFGMGNKLPGAAPAQAKAITDEVNRLMDINDAIADLLMSEQVYQTVKGNFDRVSAVANAFGKGAYPPEMQVINTPRTGLVLNHRLALHFNAEASASTETPVSQTPRAKAEPAVNEWLSEILPPPGKILCKVTYTEPGSPKQSVTVSLNDLELQPIDLLYFAAFETEQAMNALDDRIGHFVLYGYNGSAPLKPFTKVEILYTEDIDASDKSKISFFELGALIKSLRKILIGNKAVNHESFTLSADDSTGKVTYNHTETEGRINELKNSLESLKTSVSDWINRASSLGMEFYASPNLQELCELFMQISLYDSSRSGTGFIHQTLQAAFDEIVSMSGIVIKRWEARKKDYDALMNTDSASLSGQELLELLRKAERLVSTEATFPPPEDTAQYKALVENKAAGFNSVLNELKSIQLLPESSVLDFINNSNAIIAKTGAYDLVNFDTVNNRNDLSAAEQKLHLLQQDVYDRLVDIEEQLTEKLTGFDSELSAITEGTPDPEKFERQLAAARKITGDETILLPRCELSGNEAKVFLTMCKESDTLLEFVKKNEQRILPVDDWFDGVSLVRKNAWELNNAISLSAGFNPAANIGLTPLQFPYKERDRWLAMKFVKDKTEAGYNAEEEEPFESLKGDTLLYTAHFAKPYDTDTQEAAETKVPVCGVIIDEWNEVIPSRNETTGIAFHYNQPNSEPPQTMLLVVPPETNGSWEWEDIVEAMEEAEEMARKRAVEPSMIDQSSYAQFLPAAMMAVTSHGITVSTNLAINNIAYLKE